MITALFAVEEITPVNFGELLRDVSALSGSDFAALCTDVMQQMPPLPAPAAGAAPYRIYREAPLMAMRNALHTRQVYGAGEYSAPELKDMLVHLRGVAQRPFKTTAAVAVPLETIQPTPSRPASPRR